MINLILHGLIVNLLLYSCNYDPKKIYVTRGTLQDNIVHGHLMVQTACQGLVRNLPGMALAMTLIPWFRS